MHKTTKHHFELFKEEAERWINTFGLVGWNTEILHEKPVVDDRLAELSYSVLNRTGIIRLNPNWNIKPTDTKVRRVAFHEVSELLTARIECIGNTRIVGPDEMREAVHELIRVLENVLWLPEEKRREQPAAAVSK